MGSVQEEKTEGTKKKDGKEKNKNGKFKKQKTMNNKVKGALGEKYKSKKSGGDVRRAGELEPYAYIPLDPKLLSKKKEKDAINLYGGIVNNGNKKEKKQLH